jgi:2'-5' RNA ligase
MAQVSTTYCIGLTIPQETQEQLQRYGSLLIGDNPAVTILNAGNYHVSLMTVESQSRADVVRIQRVFESVQRMLQGYSFSVATKMTCVYGNRTIAAFKVRSCGAALQGWAQQESLGHLRRLFAMLHHSLTQEGIDPERMTREDQYYPNVAFARTQDRYHFEDARPQDIPEESQVQWQTSAADLFISAP